MSDKCDNCGGKIRLANYILHPADHPADKKTFFKSKVRCLSCGHFNQRVVEVNHER